MELLSINLKMKYLLLVIYIAQFLIVSNTYCQPFSFVYKTSDYGQKTNTIIHLNVQLLPARYEASLNLPVCDDNLCANLIVKVFWDLAGNYSGFDTIAGKPLTKFDHRPFTSADYQKLDEILQDKNSILRVLEKEELTDKSVKLKSSTVDAVTGATPASVKEQVVEGAVYSVYTLWHFVNGTLKDSLKKHTVSILSEKLIEQMLRSENYETQLFGLKQLPPNFFEKNTELLFQTLSKSNSLIQSYIINKIPLPYSTLDNNKAFAMLYKNLDNYSKSIFINRILNTKTEAAVFIPIMTEMYLDKDENLSSKMQQAAVKFEIKY